MGISFSDGVRFERKTKLPCLETRKGAGTTAVISSQRVLGRCPRLDHDGAVDVRKAIKDAIADLGSTVSCHEMDDFGILIQRILGSSIPLDDGGPASGPFPGK